MLKLVNKIALQYTDGLFATHSRVWVLDGSLPLASVGRLHGKEARDCRRRQGSGHLFLAQFWVSFVTSVKSLLNVPEPWFPCLKRGDRGHKRSFGLQDILAYKIGEFLHWCGTCLEAHWFLDSGVLAFSPAPLHLGKQISVQSSGWD